MSNFICHYNNSEKYYDLSRVLAIDLATPLQIILILNTDSPPNPPSLIETFTTADERKTRFKKILNWADTSGDQFPS